MTLRDFFSKQARNPSGLFGKWVMARIFDYGNVVVNELMKAALAIEGGDHVLEIGFGTGKLIAELAPRIGQGKIEGIDISQEMIALAKRKNRSWIRRDKVALHLGDFMETAFEADSFDKIFSANTIYFWPNPHRWVKRIHSLLKPGGRLILAFEDRDQLEQRQLSKAVFRLYSLPEIETLLARNGFAAEIEFESKRKGYQLFHCVIATK